MTILYLEDDAAIAAAVRDFLAEKGWRTVWCPTLAEARRALAERLPDLVLLDWNLPDGEGTAFCRALRSRSPQLPILMLTVRSDTKDILDGFACGADDYVAKPFDREVLFSRMQALLRRSGQQGGPVLQCGGIALDESRQAVTCRGRPVSLGFLEYQLLRLLLKNKGRTVTRQQLLAELWDHNGRFVNDNTLTVTMKRLREKTEPAPLPENRAQLWLPYGGGCTVKHTRRAQRAAPVCLILAACLLASGLTALLLAGWHARRQLALLDGFCTALVAGAPDTAEAVYRLARQRSFAADPGVLAALGYDAGDFAAGGRGAGGSGRGRPCAGRRTDRAGLDAVPAGAGAAAAPADRRAGDRPAPAGAMPLLDGGEGEAARLADEIGKTVTELTRTRQAALAARDRFAQNLANIAHQLKTPLTALSLAAQAAGGEARRRMEPQLARLTRLEESLLLLARLDSGTLQLCPRAGRPVYAAGDGRRQFGAPGRAAEGEAGGAGGPACRRAGGPRLDDGGPAEPDEKLRGAQPAGQRRSLYLHPNPAVRRGLHPRPGAGLCPCRPAPPV